MGITSHQLQKEFPHYREQIHELKNNDTRFSEKLGHYSELDQEIEGLEKRGAPIGDDKLHRMKQKRARLKDELYTALVNAAKYGQRS